MSKKNKQQKETEMEHVEQVASVEIKSAPVFNNCAYSMFEGNGKYHVVAVKFNDKTLEASTVEIVESNTEKMIIQERLQVLLLGADFI
jgi:hypothetical protein